jgi:hypothetical protein
MSGNACGLKRRARQKITDAYHEVSRARFEWAERGDVSDSCGIDYKFDCYCRRNSFGFLVGISRASIIYQYQLGVVADFRFTVNVPPRGGC